MTEKKETVRWHRRAESRPEEILLATLDAVCELGYRATRMDDVAARAGVTKPLIYHYFQGKEDLIHKALEWRLGQILVEMRGELQEMDSSWQERLRSFCRWLCSHWRTPEWGRFHRVVVSQMREDAPDVYRKWIRISYEERWKVVEEILRGAQQDLRPGVDPGIAARFLVAGLWQTLQLHVHTALDHNDTTDLEMLMETALEIFLAGVQREVEVR